MWGEVGHARNAGGSPAAPREPDERGEHRRGVLGH